MQIVHAEAAHARVSGLLVEVRRDKLRDLAPRLQSIGCNIFPGFPSIARNLNLPVVGAGPDGVDVVEGGRDRIYRSTMLILIRVALGHVPNTFGQARLFAREIGTDL